MLFLTLDQDLKGIKKWTAVVLPLSMVPFARSGCKQASGIHSYEHLSVVQLLHLGGCNFFESMQSKMTFEVGTT